MIIVRAFSFTLANIVGSSGLPEVCVDVVNTGAGHDDFLKLSLKCLEVVGVSAPRLPLI